jgi:hypothetical protein
MTDVKFGGVRSTRRTVAKGGLWAVPAVSLMGAAPAFASSPVHQPCTAVTCAALNGTMAFGASTYGNGVSPGTWTWQQFRNGTTGTNLFYSGGDQGMGTYNGFTYQSGQTTWIPNTTTRCDGNTNTPVTCNTVSLTGATFVAQGDPRYANVTGSLSQTLCLAAGTTYRFSVPWISYNGNALWAEMKLGVVPGVFPTGTQPTGGTSAVITRADRVLTGTRCTIRSSSATGPGVNNRSGTGTLTFTAQTTSIHTIYFGYQFQNATSYGTSVGCATYVNDIAIKAPTVTCSP